MNYLGFVDGQKIPDGYDNYIWMSERCLEGVAWCKNNEKTYEIIEKNFHSDDNLRKCRNYLETVKAQLMDYCVDILNAYHGTSYGKKAWNFLLSQWLNIYLFSFYDKYLKLKKIQEKGEKFSCSVFDEKNVVPPLDFNDYTTILFYTDDYHLFQYSELVSALGMDNRFNVICKKQYQKPKIEILEKTKGYYKVFVYRRIISLFKFITQKMDYVVLQNTYLPNGFVMEAVKKKPTRITNYITDYARYERTQLKYNIDKEWRQAQTKNEPSNDEFARLMLGLVKKYLPVAYVEDFKFIRQKTRKIYKYAMNPKAVIFANGATYNDETFKVYLMELEGKNVKLCGASHGAEYGIGEKWCFFSEYEMSDIFYTWGWTRKEKKPCEFRAMPLNKMVGRTFRKSSKNDDILYINYTFLKNISREEKCEILYDEYKEQEQAFVASLSPKIKKQMRFRMYMYEYGWHVRESWEREIEDLRFDHYKNFYDSMDNARLLVISYCSTTIGEALCANKPLLLRIEQNCIDENAIDDLNELQRVGILVYTYDELRIQLEAIVDDVEGWWNEPERQAVVKRIRDKYAYMPENAKQLWVDEILNWTK